jgi:hypothetical protein
VGRHPFPLNLEPAERPLCGPIRPARSDGCDLTCRRFAPPPRWSRRFDQGESHAGWAAARVQYCAQAMVDQLDEGGANAAWGGGVALLSP